MRIAYVAPYQGPVLRASRPTRSNLALAGNLKIELISELLGRTGHQVEILSQGEVVEQRATYYHPLRETNPADEDIPVFYASALPVPFVNGRWSANRLTALFGTRHRASPFDVVILYNLKLPQLAVAEYAHERLGLPVILEYEDDTFVSLTGSRIAGWRARLGHRLATRVVSSVDGAIGASPFLLTRVRQDIPSLLLRGVVSSEITRHSEAPDGEKRDWIVYSGTLFRGKGLEPLIDAWKVSGIDGWELHIAGDGELAGQLRDQASGIPSIVFHGLLDREENAELLRMAKICVNPHDVSQTPGNVFAFKIVEYLAAGSHVISTPMGPVEEDLEAGITYIPDNRPDTIANALTHAVSTGAYRRTATQAARARYGPDAVARALDILVSQVLSRRGRVPSRALATHRT